MNEKNKYYLRRIITTGIIAAPCFFWSKIIVLLMLVALAMILPDGDYFEDTELWFAGLMILSWLIVGVVGWMGSKLLITRPPEIIMRDHGIRIEDVTK